jgi:hypothetical protein
MHDWEVPSGCGVQQGQHTAHAAALAPNKDGRSQRGEYNSSQALTPAPFAAARCLTHRGEYVSQARGDALRLALPISVQLVLAVAAAAQRADAVAAPLPGAWVCVERWVQGLAGSQLSRP